MESEIVKGFSDKGLTNVCTLAAQVSDSEFAEKILPTPGADRARLFLAKARGPILELAKELIKAKLESEKLKNEDSKKRISAVATALRKMLKTNADMQGFVLSYLRSKASPDLVSGEISLSTTNKGSLAGQNELKMTTGREAGQLDKVRNIEELVETEFDVYENQLEIGGFYDYFQSEKLRLRKGLFLRLIEVMFKNMGKK